ncbi:MAG: c-type cytochrome [Ignavibacteriota bacterium]|nr:c-type cytochrome [Ignavibacteriota bacterium]
MKKLLFLILVVSLAAASCGRKEEKTDLSKDQRKESSGNTNSAGFTAKGKEIFYQTSNLTGLKCADCHSDGTNTGNTNTKYFSDVIGASKRTSVYSGMITGEDVKKKGAGASVCWETYLKMGRPVTLEEIDALNAYFESLKGEVKESKYTSLAVPVSDKAKLKEDLLKIGGLTPDIQNGEKKFKETCGFCHGGKTVKHVPSVTDEDFEGNLKSVAFHIRFGAKFMPFYSYEKISDQDISDITEYIMKNKKK